LTAETVIRGGPKGPPFLFARIILSDIEKHLSHVWICEIKTGVRLKALGIGLKAEAFERKSIVFSP
jgi:hypothetical protein